MAILEAQHIADHIGREDLQLGIEITHIAIVETARGLDLVLGIREFALQFEEISICFQVRIILRQSKYRLQCRREHVLCLGLSLGITASLRLHRCVARLSHLGQCPLFVLRVALHRLDKIRNQVITALELHIDIAPSLVYTILETDQTVVHADNDEGKSPHDGNDDP